jgi:hypothetical protein
VSGTAPVVANDAANEQSGKKPKKPRENGGKYGFDDYPDAETIVYDVEGIKIGDLCPCCGLGRYYPGDDRRLLEFTGGPILQPKRHIKKVLRCNLCGDEAMNHEKVVKWQPEARSALAIHKVYGMPWYRMGRIQELFGFPVGVSTLWEKTKELWEDTVQYIAPCLYDLAIEGSLWCTDDTGIRILEVQKSNQSLPEKEQRACHTTAICALSGEYKIILYMTANKYCRENWLSLLEKRKTEDKVILMSDASSQSIPKGDELNRVVPAVCLGGHGRRKFTDLEQSYPEECGYFIELISELYKNEAMCKDMTPEERLKYHKKNSAEIIGKIYTRIKQLFETKEVEPNSDLGKAMRYWLNHKRGLTAFLRTAGALLDNNWAENALRIMAIYRNASLFFKTTKSAAIMSDLFSVVRTCEENGVNAFQYLNWIQRNWKVVQAEPGRFLPWHFNTDTERIAC